jgi:hypothetical protein
MDESPGCLGITVRRIVQSGCSGRTGRYDCQGRTGIASTSAIWVGFTLATLPQDYKQAYIWFSVAVTNGYDGAAAKRDKAALELTPDALTEAQSEAAALAKKIKEIKK